MIIQVRRMWRNIMRRDIYGFLIQPVALVVIVAYVAASHALALYFGGSFCGCASSSLPWWGVPFLHGGSRREATCARVCQCPKRLSSPHETTARERDDFS
jgi:hypothetical protein